MNAPTTLGALNDVLVIGVIAVAILVVGLAAWKANQKRLRELFQGLTNAGFQPWAAPTPDQKRALFEKLGPYRDLREGWKGVVWCARGEVQGREVTLVEHRYTTGSGKNKTTTNHTIAAITAPVQWPALSLADENLLHKIAEIFGSRDVRVEDERFNKRWRVTADDESFALLVLSPEVQAWSLTLERGTLIRVGRGGICAATKAVATGESAACLSRRVCELASLLPSELEAWETATA